MAVHPDVAGFVIEQREARASFDDWRFMDTSIDEKEENLALVRSHVTDAFFASEYQSFIYLPDDPLFLTDQYEATVELVGWIDTAMKYYESLIESLQNAISESWTTVATEGAGIKLLRTDHVKKDLDAIKTLGSDAASLQILISKAGISRYKDHGDLMTKILQNMKLEKVVELLDRHLRSLGDLQAHLMHALRERREKKYRTGALILTSLLAATAVQALVRAFFLVWQWDPRLEGAITIALVVVIVFALVLLYGRSRD